MSAGEAEELTPEEVEALVAAWRVDPPREGFRGNLQRVFQGRLAQGLESPSRESSGDRTGTRGMDVERLIQRSGAGAPRADFRLALRDAFCSGAIAEGGGPAPAVRGELRPVRRLRPGWLLAAVAAAAVLVLALRPLLRPAPTWHVVDVSGTGPVRLDAERLEPVDPGGLGRRLEADPRMDSGDNRVELVYAGWVRVVIRPGTVWSHRPRNDGGLHIALESGEVYLRTLVPHEGLPLSVLTGEGEVEVTGSILGVIADSDGTCVCVVEGGVRMTCPGLQGASPAVHLVAARESLRVGPDRHPMAMPFPEGHADQHVADLLAFASR